MKKVLYAVLAIFVISLASCSNKYENSIIEYLQAKNGLDPKVYDLKEVKEVTVADSVVILKSMEEKRHQEKIDSVMGSIEKYKKELSDGAKSILSSPTLRDAYSTVITKGEYTLDSLKKVELRVPSTYQDKDSEEVLAIIYSGRVRSKKADLTYFILSPDGEKCYNSVASIDK
jgi:ribosomal silencing factor RsfS